jgi:hypothetical protein
MSLGGGRPRDNGIDAAAVSLDLSGDNHPNGAPGRAAQFVEQLQYAHKVR